ncbi:MAG: LPP20 family lipoprotein [Bacteroidia bacterium]
MFTWSSCNTPKQVEAKPKPEWVDNRPQTLDYYIGIGTASKLSNKLDYQQVAKKNALDDLVSEIKVTVSTNSVLKTVSQDKEFSQQFSTSTKVTALNTVENFEIVGSWENADQFWIYYRLSKAEYEAAKRRKMQVQIDRALDFLTRADELNLQNNFVQVIHMKIQALAAMQNYLNEDVVAFYKNKDVKLVEEIFNSIQDQLYSIKYVTAVQEIEGKIGKPLPKFKVTATLNGGSVISNLPLKAGNNGALNSAIDRSETDYNGVATFSKARVIGASFTIFLRVVVDVEKLITVDSLSTIVRTLLLSMQPPPASIKVNTEALNIFIDDEERNLSNPMNQVFFEPIVKKELSQYGCICVGKKSESDFVVRIRSNTQPQGVMWGNMLGASVDITFTIVDSQTNLELFSDGIQVKGFQTTNENAGLDAYKKSVAEVNKKLLPSLINALFSGGN